MDYAPQHAYAPQENYAPQYSYPPEQLWNQHGCCQGQNQWDGGWQPQGSWDTPQPYYGGQNAWNTYQPVSAGQIQQEPRILWSGDPGSLILEDAIEPEVISQAIPKTAMPEGGQRSKTANLVLNIMTFCAVAFLIAGSTIFAFSNNESKNLFGFRFYNVLTPSMQPLFKPGDMIFVKLTDPSQIKVGDVVTFNPSTKSDAFLTHRVAELLPAEENRPARMVTKGDFNNAADPPVNLNAVIGVHMFTIPFMGRVIDMMRSNLLLVCVCFGAIFLLLMVLRAYFAVRKETKTKEASQPGLALAGAQPTDIHAFC